MQINSAQSILQNSYSKDMYFGATQLASTQESNPFTTQESQNTQNSNTKSTDTESKATKQVAPNGEELDAQEEQYVRELESIDRNVRAHEAAHIAAGGGVVTGGASFSYTKGPDGKMYATAGEVPISIKSGKTPEETIQNARQVISAAMAPADPSPQDYKVAASAMQLEASARSEQAQENAEEVKENLEKQQEQNRQDSKIEQDSSKTEDKEPFFDRRAYAIESYSKNINHANNAVPMLEIAG